ncbi:MAG: hypothetical protein J5776_02240 [Clostridiales bacterium]|nr:hypothetical protein [Clostridiales bacterium]
MSMWYEKFGKEQDVVLSTKAFIVRNIRGYNFPDKMSDSDFDSLTEQIDKAVDKTVMGNVWSPNALGSGTESGDSLLTPESQLFGMNMTLLRHPEHKRIYYNDDAGLSVVVGSGEHLTVRAMAAGYDPSIYNKAESIVVDLERKLDMAFSDRYGFLTSNLKLTGTGFKMLYTVAIPAISKSNGALTTLRQRVGQYYWDIYPFAEQGELGNSGVYIITNVSTMGVSEDEIIKRGEKLVNDIIQFERALREKVATKNKVQTSDMYGRAYGLLRYASTISRKEAIDALSWLRVFKEYDDLGEVNVSWEKINKLTQDICWEFIPTIKRNSTDAAAIRAAKIKTILKGDD